MRYQCLLVQILFLLWWLAWHHHTHLSCLCGKYYIRYSQVGFHCLLYLGLARFRNQIECLGCSNQGGSIGPLVCFWCFGCFNKLILIYCLIVLLEQISMVMSNEAETQMYLSWQKCHSLINPHQRCLRMSLV